MDLQEKSTSSSLKKFPLEQGPGRTGERASGPSELDFTRDIVFPWEEEGGKGEIVLSKLKAERRLWGVGIMAGRLDIRVRLLGRVNLEKMQTAILGKCTCT